jgi:hypothetical protein
MYGNIVYQIAEQHRGTKHQHIAFLNWHVVGKILACSLPPSIPRQFLSHQNICASALPHELESSVWTAFSGLDGLSETGKNNILSLHFFYWEEG